MNTTIENISTGDELSDQEECMNRLRDFVNEFSSSLSSDPEWHILCNMEMPQQVSQCESVTSISPVEQTFGEYLSQMPHNPLSQQPCTIEMPKNISQCKISSPSEQLSEIYQEKNITTKISFKRSRGRPKKYFSEQERMRAQTEKRQQRSILHNKYKDMAYSVFNYALDNNLSKVVEEVEYYKTHNQVECCSFKQMYPGYVQQQNPKKKNP